MGSQTSPWWHIDGRNKDALTLFSREVFPPLAPHRSRQRNRINRYAQHSVAFWIGAAHGYAVKKRPHTLIPHNDFIQFAARYGVVALRALTVSVHGSLLGQAGDL